MKVLSDIYNIITPEIYAMQVGGLLGKASLC